MIGYVVFLFWFTSYFLTRKHWKANTPKREIWLMKWKSIKNNLEIFLCVWSHGETTETLQTPPFYDKRSWSHEMWVKVIWCHLFDGKVYCEILLQVYLLLMLGRDMNVTAQRVHSITKQANMYTKVSVRILNTVTTFWYTQQSNGKTLHSENSNCFMLA